MSMILKDAVESESSEIKSAAVDFFSISTKLINILALIATRQLYAARQEGQQQMGLWI